MLLLVSMKCIGLSLGGGLLVRCCCISLISDWLLCDFVVIFNEILIISGG